jgi:hypothetical protein
VAPISPQLDRTLSNLARFAPGVLSRNGSSINAIAELAKTGGTGNVGAPERPAAVTLGDVIGEIDKWISGAPGKPALNVPLVRPQSKVTPPAMSARFTAPWDRQATLDNDPRSDGEPGIFGHVVAAELMDMQITGPAGTKAIDNKVLHIAVLDNVWRYQQVSVSVLRNGIDINGNKRLDMNDAVAMLSRRSERVSYCRVLIRRDAIDAGFDEGR